jgi:hypothetical protein
MKRAINRDPDARSYSSNVARSKTLSEKSMIRFGYKRNRYTGRRYTHGDEFRSKAIVLAAVTFIENAKETRCLRIVLRLAINSYTSCREPSWLAALPTECLDLMLSTPSYLRYIFKKPYSTSRAGRTSA